MSKVTKEKVEKKVDENWDLVPTAPDWYDIGEADGTYVQD